MRTAIIIPALDEEGAIAAVLGDIPTGAAHEVIVVDNGSTDRTSEVARQAGARVIVEPRRGYGWACMAGVRAAKGADVVAVLDGDYSFFAEELPQVVGPIEEGWADFVLGSRLAGGMEPGAMLLHARFGNWLVSGLMRVLYGLRVTDLGPFRAIRRSLLLSLDMQEMTFGWNVEMMVKAARRGARIVEVPVRYRPRLAGQSKISGNVRGTILATYHILFTTLHYAWRK